MAEGPAFYLYKDRAGEYRWSLRAPNNLNIADSAEGYSTHSGCMDAIERVENYVKDSRLHIHDSTK